VVPPEVVPYDEVSATLTARTVRIVTRPSGARVFWNSELLDGVTPLQTVIEPSTVYNLRIEREGFQPAGLSISLEKLTAEQLAGGDLFFPLRAISVPAASEPTASEPLEEATLQAADVQDTPVPEVTQELFDPGVGVMLPVLLSLPQASIPDDARKLKSEMTVVVEVLVDERGDVSETRIGRAPLFRGKFREAALETATAARFQPAQRDNTVGRMWTEVHVTFRPE